MADESRSADPFVAACIQMRSGLDRAANTADALGMIAEAARRGAQFIMTPEMTTVVDRDAARLTETLVEGAGSPEIADFARAARQHGVFLLVGSMAVRSDEGRLANRSHLFGPAGALVAIYDKIHMFDVSLADGERWQESRVYAPGAEAVLAQTPLGCFGLSICYDLRFPHLYRALAQAGAEVLCAPAAFTRQTGRAHWMTLLRARAIENGAFVIAAAQGGLHADGRETFGHSAIIGPWGEILAEAEGDDPCIILAEIDPGRVHSARRQIPNLALKQDFRINAVQA